MARMFKMYSLMDQDNSGNVEAHEFVSTFEGIVDPTFRRWILIATGWGDRECSPEEYRGCLNALFKIADVNGDGSLSVLEFKTVFQVPRQLVCTCEARCDCCHGMRMPREYSQAAAYQVLFALRLTRVSPQKMCEDVLEMDDIVGS